MKELTESNVTIKDGKLFIDGNECTFIRAKAIRGLKSATGSFNAYKAITIKGRFVDMTFTRDGVGEPKADSKYIVLVNPDYDVDLNRLYPRVYIHDAEAFIASFCSGLKDKLLIEL